MALLIALAPVSANDDTITGKFKPSGVYGHHYTYKWYTVTWLNYCPACKHHGCLAVNPKGVPESEVTCLRCSADFDGVDGYEKLSHPRWKLSKSKVDTSQKVVIKKCIHPNYPLNTITNGGTSIGSMDINIGDINGFLALKNTSIV